MCWNVNWSHSFKVCRLWVGIGVVAFSGVVALAAEPVSEKDVADLVAHLRSIPPKTYDIEVVSEFALRSESEEKLRKSVNSIFDQTDDAAPPGQTPEAREKEVEREVQRLLSEQQRPRRIRKRCRFSEEHGYRVEMVTERLGTGSKLDTGPVEMAPFQEAFVNVGAASKPDNRSVRLRPAEKLASLYAEPGARILNENVWTGGTIGWPTLILLRSELKIGKPGEGEQLNRLAQGKHSSVRMEVDRTCVLPDGSVGRRFFLTAGGATVKIDTPADSFNPVWKLAFPNRVMMEVVSAENGVAKEWIDRDIGAPDGGRRYTLISRCVDCEVDSSLFDFKAPEGYDYVDHSVNPPRTVYADGRVQIGNPVPIARPAGAAGRRGWIWLVAGNIIASLGIFLFVLLRRRAAGAENKSPK